MQSDNANTNWNDHKYAQPVVVFSALMRVYYIIPLVWRVYALDIGGFFVLGNIIMVNATQLGVDLFEAYYTSRKNKRNTKSQLEFELNYEENLWKLHEDLVEGKYTIGPSSCFIIHDPVQREIFASQFRDRVVHHLIYNYIYDICDRQFIHDSRSCRKGKGTHYGIKRVDHFIRSCSENYSQDCYVLKLDIQGFFMAIDKLLLWPLIVQKLEPYKHQIAIDYIWLLQLIHQVTMYDPTDNFIRKSIESDWKGLPKTKSLFYAGNKKGLPIGNFTSQLFANIYMDSFDKFIKYELGCKWYGRYVDDFVIVHSDKDFLKQIVPKIRAWLQKYLHLTLHPDKIYLQDYKKGIPMLGSVIKPYRTYLDRSTLGNFRKHIMTINKDHGSLSDKYICSVINSYLGMCKHHSSFKVRKKIISHLGAWFWDSYTIDKNFLVCYKKEKNNET